MVRTAHSRLPEVEGDALTGALERELDSFDPQVRQQALVMLARSSALDAAPANAAINLHAHTFYSYNVFGYSPSKYAWLAKREGLAVAGIVDLDVLDGLEEFLDAGRLLNLKTCVSLESRVFLPEFATRVVNSPGEPGIVYHMGVGFARQVDHPVLHLMRRTAQDRVRQMTARVNAYLSPVGLDFDADVVPLTPKGNVTERHVCEAYERRAARLFPDPARRAAFWSGKLGSCPAPGAPLQSLIRAKTMKQGGVGYVPPASASFPTMAEMNRFVLEAGAIPTLAWLDGMSQGEAALEELFEVAIALGMAALNIIPDRNYSPGVKDRRLKNLHEVVALAERMAFPIIVGTEMNAPGNKFVDSFETAELQPLLPVFVRGAYIVYAHSVLQRRLGLGYLGAWADAHFAQRTEKNAFFEAVGRAIEPGCEDQLSGLPDDPSPPQILAAIR